MMQRVGVLLALTALFTMGCATQKTMVADNSTNKSLAPCVSVLPSIEAEDLAVPMQVGGVVPLYLHTTEKACKRIQTRGY